jgi:hypothetical protein
MATRTKTLWYATKLTADVADATVTNLDQITVYADSGRTFRSCIVWVAAQDIITGTGGTIGEYRVGLRLAAAAYTTVTETDDLTNTGENMAVVLGPFNFTQQFIDNFGAGTSQTLDIQVYFDQTTGTTLGMRNVMALIAVTIEYSDTGSTQYATAIVPLESPAGALPTTETELGTNQIPKLTGTGGLLENIASVTVRDQFFLIEGNEANNGGTTDWSLSVRIDTGTTLTFGTQEAALASDRYAWWLHKETPTASAAHAFKIWSSTGRLNMAVVTMFVTYEFALSGTTEFLNSLVLPFHMPSVMGGTTSSDPQRFQMKFFIEEPATITLNQSAARLYFMDDSSIAGLNFRAGSQTYRAYTHVISTACGTTCLQQRIDSGGAQGEGVSLARGENTITLDVYRTDTTNYGTHLSGFIILNYKSGVASAGLGAHNHTTVWHVYQWEGVTAREHLSGSLAPANIPETSYWVDSLGLWALHTFVGSSYQGISLQAKIDAAEAEANGWRAFRSDFLASDPEFGIYVACADASRDFARYPSDPDSRRLAVETARVWKICFANAIPAGWAMLLTYHAITYTVNGTVSGYTGDGSGLTVDVRRTDTDEKIGSATTAAGGGYSLTWYDNTINLAADLQQDATHVGRSANGTAS